MNKYKSFDINDDSFYWNLNINILNDKQENKIKNFDNNNTKFDINNLIIIIIILFLILNIF